jgi:extracellular factor (EF) 3-hydroxypalmitic acid methyl ester biosynthesis protein
MHTDPELAAPLLDRALGLAGTVAQRLAEAGADANTSFQDSLARCAAGPLPLRRLREAQDEIAMRLLDRLTPILDRAWVELGALDAAMPVRDRRIAVAAWRATVQPYFMRVPLARRSVDKPLGYPGDYGLVNLIYDEPTGGDDALGRAIARYTWNVGPCRAHRQRRPWSLSHLAQLRAQLGRPLRVASYACGPEHTLQAWLATDPATEVDLYDAEPRALDWCRRRFADLEQRLGTPLTVRTHLVSPRALAEGDVPLTGPFDAVLVLGLFDYLSAETIGALVDRVLPAIEVGGRLLCTNLHDPNPWRSFMEYLGAWQVEHRTAPQLEREVVRERVDLRTVESRLDDSGTNVFLALARRVPAAPRGRVASALG